MSYETATNKIISIIETIASSELTLVGNRSSQFKHVSTFHPEDESTWPKADRSFAILSLDWATDLRSPSEAVRHQFDDLRLFVMYNQTKNVRDLDVLINKDSAVLRKYLLDPTQWGRPTSGIVTMTSGQFSNIEGAFSRAPLVTDGRRILEQDWALRHTNQTS